jgi:hypothetical protein
MILEAVPALPPEHRNGHQGIKQAPRHYAGALRGTLRSSTPRLCLWTNDAPSVVGIGYADDQYHGE